MDPEEGTGDLRKVEAAGVYLTSVRCRTEALALGEYDWGDLWISVTAMRAFVYLLSKTSTYNIHLLYI